MNTKCDEIKDKIAELIAGILSETEKDTVLEHISVCSECSGYAEALKDEEFSLTGLFERYSEDLDRQQEEVINAINFLGAGTKNKVMSVVQGAFDSRAVRFAAAAAVIVFLAVNYIRAMSWVYELKQCMDICSISIG